MQRQGNEKRAGRDKMSSHGNHGNHHARMVADFKKECSLYNESKLKGVSLSSAKNRNHDLSDFTKSFPSELLESKNGVCVYFNPNEGQEIMQEFHAIISGFRKKGNSLSEDELNAIRGFISS